jgi:IMP cyclohydrolase
VVSSTPFSHLSSLEYPGRFLMLGRTSDSRHNILAYAVTGRSPSSQARILKPGDNDSFWTDVTDPEILARGNPALLLYPCLKRQGAVWFASNGAQTDYIKQVAEQSKDVHPESVLHSAFVEPGERFVDIRVKEGIRLDQYEPDGPTFTPRISGIVNGGEAALSIVRHVEGAPQAEVFSWALEAGQAGWITTYTGQNVPSGVALPSFQEETPNSAEIEASTAQELATQLYEALGPVEKGPDVISAGKDFRVGVLVLFVSPEGDVQDSHIINRHEGRGA